MAVGCAIACPDRKVVALTGDGSAFYTLQALWTMARENLDVTVVIFANRSYNILRGELANVGAANPGPRAIDMLTLDRPDPDWVALAKRSEEHTSELQSLMRISYAVFCLKKKKTRQLIVMTKYINKRP